MHRPHAPLSRLVGREMLLAALVLALVFLNFGHASLSLGGEVQLVPDAWCGDPLLPQTPEHPPCHACRIGGGADLPPAPALVAPVVFAGSPVAYAAPPLIAPTAPAVFFANPRAPPIA